MLKYKNSTINKLLNKLKEIKIGKFNAKIVYEANINKTDEIVIRTLNSKLHIHNIETLRNEPVEIYNAGQKIYDGFDSQIEVNLIDNTKNIVIKGNIININFYNNKLTYLNIDKNIHLIDLNCVNNNNLTTLNINTNLQSLYCNYNELSKINIDKNTHLRFLDLKKNKLELNNILYILKAIGKIKPINHLKYYCRLTNNMYTDFTQPQKLVEALNAAKANGWTISY